MVYLNSQDEKLLPYKPKLQKEWKSHGEKQMLRHEVISGILALQVTSFRKWLEQCPNEDLTIAVWAAMGHHLKIGLDKNNQPAGIIAEIPFNRGDELRIYTDHHDFQVVLDMGRKSLGLPDNLPEPPQKSWSKCELQQALISLRDEFLQIESQLNWEQQKFIAAVKATVIAADLAGSALPLVEEDFKAWMQKVLSLNLLKSEIQQLVNQRLKGKPLRPFQKKIAKTKHRVTLVKAGCGTGKTVGAYAWAEKWAVNRKLFFCYPTTGTASQGYKDTELSTGKQLLEQLSGKIAISQRDLSEVAAQLGYKIPEIVKSTWLEGDWCSYPDFLREGGSTITVLLQQDLADIREAANNREDKSFIREAQRWSVPIHIPNNREKLSQWKRIKFYLVAPFKDIYYSEETGAEPCK